MKTPFACRLLLAISMCGVTFGQRGYNKLHAGGQLGPRVSILQLVANPGAFEGKRVRVRGYFHFGEEESVIYLHKEDSDQGLTDNGIWINLPKDLGNDLAAHLNGRYVNCEAVFSEKGHGHPEAFVGELSDVHWLDISLSRAELDQAARQQ